MIHLPSGRIYIGQRKVPKGKTLESDSYFGSGAIWKHIYKNHKDECVKVIIDTASSKEEIDELEKKYIKHYKDVYGEFCVNIAEGGDGGNTGKPWNKGLTLTDEQKKNMFGHKSSDETRKKISDAIKRYIKENPDKVSESAKKIWSTRKKDPDKVSESAKNGWNTRRKDPDKVAESYKKGWNTRRKENA